MSRSRRQQPFCGITTAQSEKQDKRDYNRRFRRVSKQQIQLAPEADVKPDLREYSNPWNLSKDGKQRFDAVRLPKLMRK